MIKIFIKDSQHCHFTLICSEKQFSSKTKREFNLQTFTLQVIDHPSSNGKGRTYFSGQHNWLKEHKMSQKGLKWSHIGNTWGSPIKTALLSGNIYIHKSNKKECKVILWSNLKRVNYFEIKLKKRCNAQTQHVTWTHFRSSFTGSLTPSWTLTTEQLL